MPTLTLTLALVTTEHSGIGNRWSLREEDIAELYEMVKLEGPLSPRLSSWRESELLLLTQHLSANLEV